MVFCPVIKDRKSLFKEHNGVFIPSSEITEVFDHDRAVSFKHSTLPEHSCGLNGPKNTAIPS